MTADFFEMNIIYTLLILNKYLDRRKIKMLIKIKDKIK